MVQFIYEELLQTANEYCNQFRGVSCGICKPATLVPNGKDIERNAKDGGVYVFRYDVTQFHFEDLWTAISVSNYPEVILRYASLYILPCSISQTYAKITKEEIYNKIKKEFSGIGFYPVKNLNQYILFPIVRDSDLKSRIDKEIEYLTAELNNNSYRPGRYTVNYTKEVDCDGTNLPLFERDKEIKRKSLENLQKATSTIFSSINSLESVFFLYQEEKWEKLKEFLAEYNHSSEGICNYINYLLEDSLYPFLFPKKALSQYDETTHTLIFDYILPNKDNIPNENISKSKKWVEVSVTKQKKLYDEIIFAIVIRSLAEICHYDEKKYIEHICFNGKIRDRSPLNGQLEEKYILSINVSREQIESLNLEFIDPKDCFKYLKGVSASKLYEQIEIRPIVTPAFSDKRIVKSREIETFQSTNLAEMDWEEFEHLVRQVFEWEFSDKGGEVNVTQSSRDGGVDAIVYDPDPIRGGKIIIQAKRYTNTVPVSAVRDLYGTIINEGANKGILITTSDYGPDSYKFAQGKPITLLNGGHLLYLMEKHGRHARIDIQEAKAKIKDSK